MATNGKTKFTYQILYDNMTIQKKQRYIAIKIGILFYDDL